MIRQYLWYKVVREVTEKVENSNKIGGSTIASSNILRFLAGEWRASSDYRPAGSRRSLTSRWSLRIFEMLGTVKTKDFKIHHFFSGHNGMNPTLGITNERACRLRTGLSANVGIYFTREPLKSVCLQWNHQPSIVY
jgi:hypothetical protein